MFSATRILTAVYLAVAGQTLRRRHRRCAFAPIPTLFPIQTSKNRGLKMNWRE